MKKIALILAMLAIAGCDDDKATKEAIGRAQGQNEGVLVDNGIRDLPGRPGYVIHSYTDVIGPYNDRYLYVVEKAEVPVAGVSGEQPNGKFRRHVSTVVK